MDYIIGLIIGCVLTNVIFIIRKFTTETYGTFVISHTEGENDAIGISLTKEITEKTKTIVLERVVFERTSHN